MFAFRYYDVLYLIISSEIDMYTVCKKKLKNNGNSIEKIYLLNIVGLLSWIVRDKVNRENIHLKPYHIKIFDSIVPTLKIIESIIKIPVGISLVVVARKI